MANRAYRDPTAEKAERHLERWLREKRARATRHFIKQPPDEEKKRGARTPRQKERKQ